MFEGGQDCQEQAEEVRKKVVTRVEKTWQAGKLEEQLPQGETSWQAYIQRMKQKRRMRGPP